MMPILMRYNPHRKKIFNIPITGNKPRKTVYKEHKALLRDAIQNIPTTFTNEEYVRRRQRLEAAICALREVYKAGKGEKIININEDIFLSSIRIMAAGHDNTDDDLNDDLITMKEFKGYAMQEAEVDPRVANRADAVRNAAIIRMDIGANNTEAQAALCIRIRNTAKQLRGVTAPPPDTDNPISIFSMHTGRGSMITAAPSTRITQRTTGFFATVLTGYAGRRTEERTTTAPNARKSTKKQTNKGRKTFPRGFKMQSDYMLFDGINLMMPTMHRTPITPITVEEQK